MAGVGAPESGVAPAGFGRIYRPNVSVIPGLGIVPPLGNGLNVTCTDMWRHII